MFKRAHVMSLMPIPKLSTASWIENHVLIPQQDRTLYHLQHSHGMINSIIHKPDIRTSVCESIQVALNTIVETAVCLYHAGHKTCVYLQRNILRHSCTLQCRDIMATERRFNAQCVQVNGHGGGKEFDCRRSAVGPPTLSAAATALIAPSIAAMGRLQNFA